MTEEATQETTEGGQQDGDDQTANEGEPKGPFAAGIKQGLGVLSALKDALEETISDVKSRGDLSQERAKKAFRDAMSKAQETAGAAREKLDFVNQQEFDQVIGRLRDRIRRIEEHLGLAQDESEEEEDS